MTEIYPQCSLRRVGEIEPDGARWIHCSSCGIVGKAYTYPHPDSNVRCFLTTPWPDDEKYIEPTGRVGKGIALGIFVLVMCGLAFISVMIAKWLASFV